MSGDDRVVLAVLSRLGREYPQAGTRLKFSSLFQLLVAVMLSAQSTDEQVNRVTANLFKKYSQPGDFAVLEPSELEPLIKGCGLHRNKARNIIQTARILVNKYDGQVPEDLERLVELPGVGRKTANVVLSVGFNQPGLGVDTHVKRVTGRLGWHKTRTPDHAERILKQIIPVPEWSRAHHLFIAHGRSVCKARKPRCNECVIAKYCQYFHDHTINTTDAHRCTRMNTDI